MINQRNKKDCTQATLANLLNIPYEKIPAFYEEYEKTGDFLGPLDAWLKSIGRYRLSVDVTWKGEELQLPFVVFTDSVKAVGVLGKDDRPYTHAVLLEIRFSDGEYKTRILHDPRPDTDYDIFDLVSIELLLLREQ